MGQCRSCLRAFHSQCLRLEASRGRASLAHRPVDSGICHACWRSAAQRRDTGPHEQLLVRGVLNDNGVEETACFAKVPFACGAEVGRCRAELRLRSDLKDPQKERAFPAQESRVLAPCGFAAAVRDVADSRRAANVSWSQVDGNGSSLLVFFAMKNIESWEEIVVSRAYEPCERLAPMRKCTCKRQRRASCGEVQKK